jgi:hypothetical protein
MVEVAHEDRVGGGGGQRRTSPLFHNRHLVHKEEKRKQEEAHQNCFFLNLKKRRLCFTRAQAGHSANATIRQRATLSLQIEAIVERKHQHLIATSAAI